MSESVTMDDSLWSRLPSDIVANVLVRLPVKSLCRFKCVSPSWKSIISSPQFSQTHLDITIAANKPPKALLTSIATSEGDLHCVDLADANPTAEKLASLPNHRFGKGFLVSKPCGGLLLVYGISYDHRVVMNPFDSSFLLNPFTSECKKLPKPTFSSEGFVFAVRGGLGYDSCTDDYKVVIVCNLVRDPLDPLDGSSTVAVYSLKADAWNTVQASYNSLALHTGVYLNGHLHWINADDLMNAIAFNLSDETFREIMLPDYELFHEKLDILKGCLCLFCLPEGRDGGIEFWMMTKYGVTDSWTKFMVANPRMRIERVLCVSAEDDEFVMITRGKMADVNGETVVDESQGNQLVLYNPEKETVRVMIVPVIPTKFSFSGYSVETLISPNHQGQILSQRGASTTEVSKIYQLIAKENPSTNPAN